MFDFFYLLWSALFTMELELNQLQVSGRVSEDHSQALLLDIKHGGFSVDVDSVSWVILLDASGSMASSVDHLKKFLQTFIVQAERFFLDCDFTIVKFTHQVTIVPHLSAVEALQVIQQ
jgi:hypothetical protein